MAPTYSLYYANLDLVNVVSEGSSFIIIKLNAFESVVFTKGNFISVKMSVLQNISPLGKKKYMCVSSFKLKKPRYGRSE